MGIGGEEGGVGGGGRVGKGGDMRRQIIIKGGETFLNLCTFLCI